MENVNHRNTITDTSFKKLKISLCDYSQHTPLI